MERIVAFTTREERYIPVFVAEHFGRDRELKETML